MESDSEKWLVFSHQNTPREAVLAARGAGFDVIWMVELQPGAGDEIVLGLAQREARVLITFDNFGELVFRHGRPGSPGVILFRPRLRSPEVVTAFIVTVLSQRKESLLIVADHAPKIVPIAPGTISIASRIVPGALGNIPRALGDIPRALGDIPRALGDIPRALGNIPGAL